MVYPVSDNKICDRIKENSTLLSPVFDLKYSIYFYLLIYLYLIIYFIY